MEKRRECFCVVVDLSLLECWILLHWYMFSSKSTNLIHILLKMSNILLLELTLQIRYGWLKLNRILGKLFIPTLIVIALVSLTYRDTNLPSYCTLISYAPFNSSGCFLNQWQSLKHNPLESILRRQCNLMWKNVVIVVSTSFWRT